MRANTANKIIIIVLILFGSYEYANTESKEYLLKAGFFAKFADFVEWPNNTDIDDLSKPFLIEILGDNPFGNILDNMYNSQKIRGKKVKIRYIDNIDEISDCKILFICSDMKNQIETILKRIGEKPILSISESDDLAKIGVHINFYITTRGTIHFEINEKKAKQANLKIDILLLEIAKIVN